tara:strand:+ start:655 stop:975 length:321 start_codon:yes stop_codon:yes gene_type:complete
MDRISNQVLEILAEIKLQYIDLSNLGLVTFTRVDVAPDLKTAKIFYSVLGRKKKDDIINIEINKKRKAFKKYLGKKLHIRYIPDLKFYLDESFIYGEKISKLIKSL